MPAGTPVTLAIRPEKITLHAARPDAANMLSGRIVTTTYMGDRSHHFVAVEGLPKPIVVSVAE